MFHLKKSMKTPDECAGAKARLPTRIHNARPHSPNTAITRKKKAAKMNGRSGLESFSNLHIRSLLFSWLGFFSSAPGGLKTPHTTQLSTAAPYPASSQLQEAEATLTGGALNVPPTKALRERNRGVPRHSRGSKVPTNPRSPHSFSSPHRPPSLKVPSSHSPGSP